MNLLNICLIFLIIILIIIIWFLYSPKKCISTFKKFKNKIGNTCYYINRDRPHSRLINKCNCNDYGRYLDRDLNEWIRYYPNKTNWHCNKCNLCNDDNHIFHCNKCKKCINFNKHLYTDSECPHINKIYCKFCKHYHYYYYDYNRNKEFTLFNYTEHENIDNNYGFYENEIYIINLSGINYSTKKCQEACALYKIQTWWKKYLNRKKLKEQYIDLIGWIEKRRMHPNSKYLQNLVNNFD